MKKLLIGILALGSLASFAHATKSPELVGEWLKEKCFSEEGRSPSKVKIKEDDQGVLTFYYLNENNRESKQFTTLKNEIFSKSYSFGSIEFNSNTVKTLDGNMNQNGDIYKAGFSNSLTYIVPQGALDVETVYVEYKNIQLDISDNLWINQIQIGGNAYTVQEYSESFICTYRKL